MKSIFWLMEVYDPEDITYKHHIKQELNKEIFGKEE